MAKWVTWHHIFLLCHAHHKTQKETKPISQKSAPMPPTTPSSSKPSKQFIENGFVNPLLSKPDPFNAFKNQSSNLAELSRISPIVETNRVSKVTERFRAMVVGLCFWVCVCVWLVPMCFWVWDSLGLKKMVEWVWKKKKRKKKKEVEERERKN